MSSVLPSKADKRPLNCAPTRHMGLLVRVCACICACVCILWCVCLCVCICYCVCMCLCLCLCVCACTCPVRPKTLNLRANTSYKCAGVCVCVPMYVCVCMLSPALDEVVRELRSVQDDLIICSIVLDASGQVMLRTHTHTLTHLRIHIQTHTHTTMHTHRCCYITSSECSIS